MKQSQYWSFVDYVNGVVVPPDDDEIDPDEAERLSHLPYIRMHPGFKAEIVSEDADDFNNAYISYKEARALLHLTKNTINYHVKMGRLVRVAPGILTRASVEKFMYNRPKSGRKRKPKPS